MPAPWEKYQAATPAAVQPSDVQAPGKPWEKYSDPGVQAGAPPAPLVASGSAPVVPQTTLQKMFGVHPVSDTLSTIGTHFGNLFSGPFHAVTDAPRDADEQQAKGSSPADGMVKNALGQVNLGVYRTLVKPTIDAVHQSAQLRKMGGAQSSYTAGSTYDSDGQNVPTAGSKLVDAIPLVGPWMRNAEDEAHQKGYLPAAAGAAVDFAAPEAGGEVLGGTADAIRKPFTGGVDTPMAGSTVTPRMRYEAAQRLGVQFDAADATNSTPLKLLKKINRDSLTGSPVYDAAASRNVGAVRGATDGVLKDMSPHDPAQGGSLIQQRLKADQAGLRDSADTQFRMLDDATGGAPVPGAADVGNVARGILKEESPFYTKYPSFKPSTAMSALQDLSKVGDTSSYGELQRLRSNTHELTTANPDLVKDQGTSWLQHMTGTLDDAITDKGLTPPQASIFRDANAKWADMKGQYDDPSSPLYHAIRRPDPSALSSGIGSKTPETLENLRPRLGEDGFGAMQRGVTTDLLKNDADGEFDLRGFGKRLNGLPDAYRDSLYGPELNSRLRDIAHTTQALGTDFNPSGTFKQLQKASEMTALGSTLLGHPTGLVPLLQYPLARMMNSPALVRFLMKDRGGAGPFTAPPVTPQQGGGGQGSGPVTPGPSAYAGPMVKRIGGDAAVDAPARTIKEPTAPAPSSASPASATEGLDGGTTELHIPGGTMPARYRVVEADSLIPSHNATNFKPDSRYPAGVQERDYAGNRENQLRVIQNAQAYKPQLTVTDNPDGINGPPVVTPDGIVLGGNSRVMSTQRLYGQDGTPYKDYLKARAEQFGVKPDAVDAMKKPVLVRQVDPEGDQDGMRWLGSQLNKPMTGAMSGSERAVSLGKGVSPETLQTVRRLLNEAGDGATLRDVMADPARSHALLMRMQEDGILGPQERPEFVDTATGGMNADGKTLFEKALMGSVLGDSRMMDAAPKHVMQKLNASIGPLAELGSRSDEWNVLPALRRAIGEHGKMAASGIGVDDHLNQASVFDKPLTPIEEHLTRLLGENQNVVRDAFGTYGKDAQYATPGQATFLGPSAHEAFNHAFGAKLTPEQFNKR